MTSGLVPRDAAVAGAGLLERAQESSAAATGGEFQECSPPPLFLRSKTMGWVTGSYLNGGQRPSRYVPTDEHWLELQRRLGRWGNSSHTWRRLEHLGAIAKAEE